MKIEYDVTVDKVQSKPTGEHTQSLKDFIASGRDNMLLDFDDDIKEATRCQAVLVMFVGRWNKSIPHSIRSRAGSSRKE